MSCGRIVVLGLALLALTIRLALREYLLEYLLPQFTERYKDGEDEIDLPSCTVDSVTTTSLHDLLVSANDTVAHATAVTRQHGVAFFEDLLTRSQAEILRNYILRENHNPSREKWFVLNGAHRRHLTFGIHEDTIVTSAIHSILTSTQLQGALRELLGRSSLDNVALVELASITSMYGARGQSWHKDVVPREGQVDLYSLFIPLQDTVEEQGPTGVCAGTHQCANKNLNCDTWSRSIKATTNAGTGALMNAQLYHHGSKHDLEPEPGETTESTARVMFYMSFAESPSQPDGYRYPPKGATYALHPSMWGLTVQQVLEATSSSWFSWWFWPWSLRATLGLVLGKSLGPQHRGWTQLEMACFKWALDLEFAGFEAVDAEEMADWSSRVAVALLVLYTLIAELDFMFLRRKQKRFRLREFNESQGTLPSQLVAKAKVA